MVATVMADATARPVSAFARWATAPIRWIDRALLAHYAIFEFTGDPQCLLRVGFTPSPNAVVLRDGTAIAAGEAVAELHLWSNRSMGVRSGIELRRRMLRSFAEFAEFARRDPRCSDFRAVLIRTSACDQFPRPLVEKLAAKWGFEIDEQPRSRRERFTDFWDNVYIALLGLAYPSGPLRVRRRLERLRIWISRETLFERYLPGAPLS